MSKRKTIAVEDLKEMVNMALRQDISEERRHGMCSVLEAVLHTTGNYHGFNYVDWLEGGSARYFEDQPTGAMTPDDVKVALNPRGLEAGAKTADYIGPEYKRRYY